MYMFNENVVNEKTLIEIKTVWKPAFPSPKPELLLVVPLSTFSSMGTLNELT